MIPFLLSVMAGLLVLLVLMWAYARAWPVLFGAWYCTGWFGRMAFWTRAQAERYRRYSGDPYARGLQGPIVFQPGRLLRRQAARSDSNEGE